jgi:hypothetical protein
VAQLGRALEWGSRGPGFKSRRPDFSKLGRTSSVGTASLNLRCFANSAIRGEFAEGGFGKIWEAAKC